MSISLKKAVVSILIVALILGLIGAFVTWKNRTEYRVRTDQAAVIKQMQSLSRYETVVFTIEKIIEAGTQGNRFQELLFGDRILLIAHGQVTAGFDLAQLTEDDISIEDDRITLRLPPPQVLSTRLDSEQTRVYDRQQGLLTKGEADLESTARQAAEETIRQAACEGGILQQASDNAQSQLAGLLRSLDFTQVEITIPSAQCQ